MWIWKVFILVPIPLLPWEVPMVADSAAPIHHSNAHTTCLWLWPTMYLVPDTNITSPSKMEERRKPLFGLTG